MDELHAIHHPHDALFRGVFGDPQLAAELLRATLPAGIADPVDWRSLRSIEGSLVDDALVTQDADLLFAAETTGETVLFYVLLEHKAEEDPFTAFQLLRYIVRIQERFRHEHPDEQGLPTVLPLVIHHGRRPWRGATELAALFRTAHLPPAFLARQVALGFQVFDLARDDIDLHSLGLNVRVLLPLLHMQWLRRVADSIALLLSWHSLYRTLLAAPRGPDIARRLVSYVAAVSDRRPSELRDTFRRIHPVMEKHYMSTADQILRQGVAQGVEQGMQRGVRQGMLQGTAQTVLRLLEHRFGPLDAATVARVRGATIEELDDITARILTASTLGAVFAS